MSDRGTEHDARGDSPDHVPHWIFKLGVILNVAFFVGDLVVFVFLSRSAAIFGDSLHNGLHALAHIFALHGHGLESDSAGKDESHESRLSKYTAAQRIGYLIVGGAILIAILGGQQIYHPREIESGWMIFVASLDIISNIVLLRLFWPYREDPTVKAIFADIMIDTLASVGVIIGGIVILSTGYYRADGLAAIPIAIIALRTARKTIREAREGIRNLHHHEHPH